MTNPFALIQVYDIQNADLKRGEPLTRVLQRAMRAEGVRGPLVAFPPSAASEIEKTIRSSPAAFWSPSEIWTGWPAAIARALPPFGDSASYGEYDGLGDTQTVADGNPAPCTCVHDQEPNPGPTP